MRCESCRGLCIIILLSNETATAGLKGRGRGKKVKGEGGFAGGGVRDAEALPVPVDAQKRRLLTAMTIRFDDDEDKVEQML